MPICKLGNKEHTIVIDEKLKRLVCRSAKQGRCMALPSTTGEEAESYVQALRVAPECNVANQLGFTAVRQEITPVKVGETAMAGQVEQRGRSRILDIFPDF